MEEPNFLSLEQVLEIHREAIATFGGTPGIRDKGALESAVLHPQNAYGYAGGDLFDIAAAYAYHIAEAQAFLDGNKRAAVGAALTFLEGNRVPTDCDSAPIYDAMIAIAEKRISKTELATLLQSWIDDPSPQDQQETGEHLIRALDEDRLADRQLFPPELKDVTW